MSKQRATAVSWPNKPMPDARKELLLDGQYTREEFVTISQGLVPQSPADKWFIYLEGQWLYCHRSASGSCIFQLQITPSEEGYAADLLLVNQAPGQYRSLSDEYDVALVSYLIDAVLLGRFAPFPQPEQFSQEDHAKHQQHVMGQAARDGGLSLRVVNGNR
ncbi:MAG: hypothetical protein H6656_15425 [Ardenticatenaceae bacterium]|nr:hypothetical protein [Anaerolineales bacterium]MCB9008734.1 hypothetical protein [Ardenticatenaceae bacterium]